MNATNVSEVDSAYSWFRLLVCLLIGTIGSVGIWAIVIVIPSVQTEFGVDRAAASIPYTFTMIGYALGNVVIGRFVDRYGMALPAIVAAICLGFGFIIAAQTTSIWQLAAIQGLLIGMGSAATFGPLIADISHWFKRRRGVAVAVTASGNYLAGAVWPVAIKGYIATDGWRSAYVSIGVFCLLTMIPLALFLARKPRTETTQSSHTDMYAVGSFPLSPRMLQTLLMIAGISCCVAMSMPQVHIVAYSVDLEFGVMRGAEMLSLMLAGGVISRIAFGYFSDYLGGLRTCLIASSLQCIALFFYLPFDSLAALYIISFMFGLSQGGIVPSYAIIIREYLPASEAGVRVGLVLMCTILGMALGGWLSGWIYDMTGSYEKAFLHGIAWNLTNMSILAYLTWISRRKRLLMTPSI